MLTFTLISLVEGDVINNKLKTRIVRIIIFGII